LSTESGRITAALPFCVYEGIHGPVINSLPFFGSHGGIISSEKNTIKSQEIIDALLNYATTIDCASVTIIESLFNKEAQEIFIDFDHQDSRIGLYNDINDWNNFQDIMDSFESRARNSIKKAIKSKVEVIESKSLESIDFLARIHFENMTSAGRKAKSKEFFFEFLEKISNENWIILEAHLNGARIASLLLIFTSEVVEYFAPVTVTDYKPLQPLSLLIWRGLVFAKEKEIRYWNWGGTWGSQLGVYKFKKQWNPIETQYAYHTKVIKPSILDVDPQTLMQAYPFFYVYPIKNK
jgi:lipid II:glycine glycyltransferase (peptidoglycan interpeptide bridge formation enzyme)